MEKSQTAWGKTLILIGGILFVGLVVALHWLSPEFLPARHSLSQYALGDFGILMTIAYVALALALGGAAYRVIVEFPEPASSKPGAFLLLLAAFSFIFAGLLPADPGDVGESVLGQYHTWSLYSGMFMSLLGSILVALKMRDLPGVWGWLSLTLTVLANSVNYWYRNAPEGLAGWEQRALFATLVIWLFAVAFTPVEQKQGKRR